MSQDTYDPLLAQIQERIDWYSTALIKIPNSSGNQLDDRQIGSGTFISVEGEYGILTAHHVAAELDGSCSLGLILTHDVHRFAIDKNHLTICPIAKPVTSSGPDMAFIGLHHPDIGTIKSLKHFYDLSTIHHTILNDIPPLDRGGWFVWGVPGELTTAEPPEKGFQNVAGFHSICGLAHADREYESNGYDYIEIEVEYGKQLDVPTNFGGYSGGGIWQVAFKKSESGDLSPTDYLLSGLVFYQSKIENQIRYLKCHGRRSIYHHAYDKIKNKCV